MWCIRSSPGRPILSRLSLPSLLWPSSPGQNHKVQTQLWHQLSNTASSYKLVLPEFPLLHRLSGDGSPEEFSPSATAASPDIQFLKPLFQKKHFEFGRASEREREVVSAARWS